MHSAPIIVTIQAAVPALQQHGETITRRGGHEAPSVLPAPGGLKMEAPDCSAAEACASVFSMLVLNLRGSAHDIARREAEQLRSRFPKSAEHRFDVGDDSGDD